MKALAPRTPRRQAAGLAAWLLLTAVAAALGALASLDAPAFYAELALPSWAPPPAIFGPVWTVLYAAMGVAAWLVWRGHGFARPAHLLFVVQLAANALWSWLFFGWHWGALAFADIVVLWVLVAANALAFLRLDRLAAALLSPYLAWVSFAAALNLVVWRMNPERL